MKRILVVDDDQQFLKMVTIMLIEEGFYVGAAESGKHALAILTNDGPWDLVLCDILMPEPDGIETILAIMKQNSTQKIIAMSGGGALHAPYAAVADGTLL
ncbi:MAG: response regulator [Magnetococcales bacterium]|nr:response regulator [Magnetococcales bacterium]